MDSWFVLTTATCYSDDTSTNSVEFCSSAGDLYPKMTAYSASPEVTALALSNIQVKGQDPGVYW